MPYLGYHMNLLWGDYGREYPPLPWVNYFNLLEKDR